MINECYGTQLNIIKIRQGTIIYSKAKARKNREKAKQLEEALRNCTIQCDNNPSKENLEELECLQAEYDQLYNYITQGAIIRSIITLIEKKGKDNRMIKNWRPISLINVDAKIASKTLAKRLEQVLPRIIHSNPNAFVKGRSLFDGIRTIDDVMEYTKEKELSGILVAIDFEKSFDTLNFDFLISTLHKFNFGPSFIQWIRLYKNVSRCVMNNGFTTGPFMLSRGERQGDPPSPYLFIIALGTLAIQ